MRTSTLSLLVRRVLPCAWLLLMLARPSDAAAQDVGRSDTRRDQSRTGTPADVVAAQTFLFAAYPDLVGRSLLVTLRQEPDALLVSVVDESNAAPAAAPTPLLVARFEYDAGARLRRYDGYGPLLSEARHLALQDQLLANPRWNDSDADAWLIQEGVTSTFGTTFAPARPDAARALEQQIGVSRTAAPARFLWYQAGTETDAKPAFRDRPAWVTEAAMPGPDGTDAVYQFEYEPFGGRLMAVTRKGGR